jgi:hypothetical protein
MGCGKLKFIFSHVVCLSHNTSVYYLYSGLLIIFIFKLHNYTSSRYDQNFPDPLLFKPERFIKDDAMSTG